MFPGNIDTTFSGPCIKNYESRQFYGFSDSSVISNKQIMDTAEIIMNEYDIFATS
jgi:hypothetical protein